MQMGWMDRVREAGRRPGAMEGQEGQDVSIQPYSAAPVRNRPQVLRVPISIVPPPTGEKAVSLDTISPPASQATQVLPVLMGG